MLFKHTDLLLSNKDFLIFPLKSYSKMLNEKSEKRTENFSNQFFFLLKRLVYEKYY